MGQSGRRAGPARKRDRRAVPGPPARHDARHGPHETSIGPYSVGPHRAGPNRARAVLGPGGPFGILYYPPGHPIPALGVSSFNFSCCDLCTAVFHRAIDVSNSFFICYSCCNIFVSVFHHLCCSGNFSFP
jgi:hypothetical protein